MPKCSLFSDTNQHFYTKMQAKDYKTKQIAKLQTMEGRRRATGALPSARNCSIGSRLQLSWGCVAFLYQPPGP